MENTERLTGEKSDQHLGSRICNFDHICAKKERNISIKLEYEAEQRPSIIMTIMSPNNSAVVATIR